MTLCGQLVQWRKHGGGGRGKRIPEAVWQQAAGGREGPTRFVYPVPAKPRLVDCVPRVVNTSARKPPSFADARTNHGHENGEPQPFEQRHADLEASTRAERRHDAKAC
jgi:hypothetical protein